MMVAIRPIAGVKNVIFTEDVPKGAERLLVEGRTAPLLDACGDYFRKLDEDVFVLRQVVQQRPILIAWAASEGTRVLGR